MAEEKVGDDEYRFSLKAMLREIEADAAQEQLRQKGPVDQAEILKMIQKGRKQSAND